MSDWYGALQNAGEYAADTWQRQQEGNDPFKALNDHLRPVWDRMSELQEKYSDLPPMATWEYEQYDKILPSIANSEDSEAMMDRFNNALYFSKYFDKPLADTFQNLEQYYQEWTGDAYIPKTFPKAVADSFASSFSSIRYSRLGLQLMLAGGEDEILQSRLAVTAQRMEELQDNVPRPFWQDAIKFGANTLVYSGAIVAAGALTGGIGSAAAVAAGASSKAVLAAKAAASMIGRTLTSFPLLTGAEYADLRSKGVRHDIAAPIAGGSGLLQAVTETFLGNIAGTSAKLVGVSSITDKVMKKFFISGRSGAVAKAIMGYVGESIEEGAEELIQSLTSSLGLELAARLQTEGGVDTQTAEEIARGAMEDFRGGFLSSLLLGIPSSAIGYRNNVQESKRVASMASLFDKDTFVNQAKGLDLSLLEGMTDEKKQETLESIWTSLQRRKGTQNAPDIKQNITDFNGPNINNPAAARRMEDGRIYTRLEDQGTKDDLSEIARLKIGDPNSGAKYGEIRYRLDNDTVLVDQVQVADYITDRESVIHDAMVELASLNPGLKLEWNPTDPAQMNIKDQLISENPRGRDAGLNWFDADSSIPDTRKAAVIKDAIQKNFKNLSAREVQMATSLVYETSRSLGFRPEDVVGRSLEITTQAELRANPEIAAQLDEALAGRDESGGTVFLRNNDMLGLGTASREFEQGVKAVIYAAENATFSTFAHEWFHFLDVGYIGRSEQHRKLFEEALGKRYDQITAEDREQMAYSFEKYLSDGTAPTEGLKNLFQRIARAMAKAISALGRTMTLSPELRKGFDALFQGDTQLKRDAAISQQENDIALASQYNAMDKNIDSKPVQPSNNLDEIYNLVEEARSEFNAWAQALVDKYGGKLVSRKELKAKDRAARKITALEGAETILDIDGKTLVLDDLDTVYRVMKDLVSRDEIVRAKDRYTNPPPVRYRDMLLNVRMSNGAVVELQLNTPQMLDAKEKYGGHILYEIDDQVKAGHKAGKVTDTVFDEVSKRVTDTMAGLYDAAFTAVLEGANFNARSFDISEQLVEISRHVQESGTLSNVLSEKTRNKLVNLMASTLSSQSTNTNSGSSKSGIGIIDNTSSINNTDTLNIGENGDAVNTDPKVLLQGKKINLEQEKTVYDMISNLPDAQKKLNRQILNGDPITTVELNTSEKSLLDAVAEWASGKTSNLGHISRIIPGEKLDIVFSKSDIDTSFGHTKYKNKLHTLPVVRTVIENGAYMGMMEDIKPSEQKNTKEEPIIKNNYYFAAPILMGTEKKILLVRVVQEFNESGEVKSPVKFYVHEVYDEETDINNSGSRLQASGMQSRSPDAQDPDILKSIIWYSKNINSNHGENKLLTQLTDTETLNEAARFDSWQEWKDYVETTSEWDIGDSAKPDGVSDADLDVWYKAKWEEAHKVTRDETGAEVKSTPEFTSEEIDEQFMSRLAEDGELERFLEALYEAGNPDIDSQAADEEEALARDEAVEMRDRVSREIHPTLANNAVRVSRGRPLTDTARKSIMTLIERGARYYRSLYTDITGDEEFSALTEQEIKTLPDIVDPDGPPLSIVERMRLERQIKNEEVRKALADGSLVPDDVRGYINSLEDEKKNLEVRLRVAEKEIQEDVQLFSRQERAYYQQQETISDLEKSIRANEREIEQLEGDLARVRARERTGRQAATQRLQDEQQQNREQREALNNTARERRERLSASYEARLTKTRDTLRERRATLKEVRSAAREAMASARAQATLQKRMALDSLREQIRQKDEERREAAKVLTYKRKLVAHIMAKPSKAIWYEDAEKIRALQRTVDPQARAAVVKWEGETYDVDTFRKMAVEKDLIDILSPALVKRLFKKSIDEWTVSELEEMASEIDRLRSAGRATWHLKQSERKASWAIGRRSLMNEFAENPKYVEAAAAGSKERQEQLKKLDSGFKKVATTTWTLSRIADWLDGSPAANDLNAKRANTQLLITEERQVYADKMDNIDRRQERVTAYMKDHGIDLRSLYEKEHTIREIGPNSSDVTYTVSDLMYIYIGLRDLNTRAAIVYGNLMDQAERSTWDNKILEAMGEDKIRALSQFVEMNLTSEEKGLANEISRDFRDEFGRLNDVFLNEFNLVMRQVDSYVPMITQDVTASGKNHEQAQAQEILNVAGTSIKRTPDKGFTVSRQKISPRNQRAIKLDLYGTWLSAVERQEHFAAYTSYIRKLNGVYKNSLSSESRMVRHQITQIYGPEVMRRVDAEINALANPKSFRDDKNVDRLVRAMRGNLGVGYLAMKTSSVLKQLVASPMPYLSYVTPLDMAASAMEYMQNPRQFDADVKSKSAIMRHRVANPIIEIIKKSQETNKGKRGLAWFQEIGMKGLEMADWVSVVTGWHAVYKKALRDGLTETDARNKADDITLKSQPSAREQDLSPLFKTGSEGFKLLTQFQTALNVIWNQFTYDLPMAIKNKDFQFVIRMVSAYALAGIAMNLLAGGFDDDDDELNRKRFAYWSFSQFFESVPLIGSGVSIVAEQAITGERRRFYNSPLLPAASELLNAASNAVAGDWGKAAGDFAESVGLGLGLPVSGVKELGRVVGVGGDGFNPEALIGRR